MPPSHNMQQSIAGMADGEMPAHAPDATNLQQTEHDATHSDRRSDADVALHRRGLFALTALVGASLGFWSRPARAGHNGGNNFHIGTGPTPNVTPGSTVLSRVNKATNSWAFLVDNSSQTGNAIRGDVNSTGVGVLGNNISFNQGGRGVWGFCASGIGVFGSNEKGDERGGGYGVVGVSPEIGVQGEGDYAGVIGWSERNGVEGYGKKNADVKGESPTIGVAGVCTQASGYAGHFVGNVYVSGNLYVKGDFDVVGAKNAAVAFPDGSRRRLYSLESPQSWFEDFGEATLANGSAEVPIDQEFIAVAAPPYHIFITPYGESRGLYVAARSPQSFRVREHGGGASSIAFSYRIVGRRKDIAGERFARVAEPQTVDLGSAAKPVPIANVRPPSRRGQ